MWAHHFFYIYKNFHQCSLSKFTTVTAEGKQLDLFNQLYV